LIFLILLVDNGLTLDFRAASSCGRPSSSSDTVDHGLSQSTKRKRSLSSSRLLLSGMGVIVVDMQEDRNEVRKDSILDNPAEIILLKARDLKDEAVTVEREKVLRTAQHQQVLEENEKVKESFR
jgi:hypothetical protein